MAGKDGGVRGMETGLKALMVVAVAGLAPAGAWAAVPVAEASVPAPVLAGTVAPVAAVAADTMLSVSVSLPMRNTAARDALLREIYDPASPSYRHYLSVGQYTELFGPTASDYASVAAFFRGQGLSVQADAANRALVVLTGRAGDMTRVFHVALNYYQHPTEHRLFFAPDRAPSVDLTVPLLDVIGLDDYVLPTPRIVKAVGAPLGGRTTGSGPGGDFIGSDLRTAYYGSGTLNGAGQSVGLMELAGYNLTSVQTYFTKVKQPLNVAVVGVQTDSHSLNCTGSCDDSEQALDIEYAISMAPGLSKVQVYVGSNAEDVLNRQVSDDTSKELSTSWGWGQKFSTDDALFKEMAMQGQTMLTASGDYSSLKASGPWPEEDANLTAVGGTDLVTNGAGGAWKSETGWSSSAGGPSLNASILIESYQKPYINAANGGSTTVRNVPDVAAQADINMYYCANSGCGTAGGTSFASPTWAGFVALANQQAVNTGHGLAGFLNPTLYANGMDSNVASLFHDETSGTSGKYSCTKSYDLVTGIGSPNTGLVNVLAGL
jgi:subtilase family serine protease